MKKITLLLLALLTLTAYATQPGTDPKNIEKGWRKTNIKVQNGGNQPTVMQLLKAFNTVWPTKPAAAIIAVAGDKDYFAEEWYEGESPVFVDNIDYCCAWYNNSDATGEQNLDSRTYLRTNGHTLFVVCIETYNPEQKAFCCFYDYNPKTQTLTPEAEPYRNMKRKSPNSFTHYLLGEKFDQTFIVEETSRNGDVWYHHYAWNGMKHEFHHVGEDCYASEDEGDEEEYEEGI